MLVGIKMKACLLIRASPGGRHTCLSPAGLWIYPPPNYQAVSWTANNHKMFLCVEVQLAWCVSREVLPLVAESSSCTVKVKNKRTVGVVVQIT